uniref:Uncharacterized protein n=1 Tax=Fibrocapsa japonica TaxID=94617 RepID=A0A7S2V4U2_9STRA|mmetsp:Transcript_3016/g.4443  ORF Transcript_3016/g.4443 Transcript_3016/m.4443 type:complete len:145 (+) Transcript_3016:65-499(+)|eukprot:CAMPEP_0113944986 /NCGR_PEP_ID=MMETSP1339-20121228/38419_1 /TAXON_ID=94617 /ORGANISM="Fibrocapsa japonica" /LENGTH=144 /DNA_ID=CAMNT_0000950371 /DNA_START=59 /DNA_END=493 /DNA_ORIENTATION=- /assembly_acc=CAM_ASM_000762
MKVNLFLSVLLCLKISGVFSFINNANVGGLSHSRRVLTQSHKIPATHTSSKTTLSAVPNPAEVVTSEIYGPIFLGGIGIIFATLFSTFIVAGLIDASGLDEEIIEDLGGGADKKRVDDEIVKAAEEKQKKLEAAKAYKDVDDYA